MALDMERQPAPELSGGEMTGAALPRAWASKALRALLQVRAHAANLIRRTAPYRFFSATIARRIFLANLLGLFVLLAGIVWLSQHQAWLITAKRESLKVQGEIIAAAIAANANIDTDRITFDPERLPEVEGARLPYRDDAFAALELSLRPDRVGPVLRRLIQPSHNTRARIYGREGELIVDTQRGIRADPIPADPEAEALRVRTWWTRLFSFIDGTDLPVYREIGTANGNKYFEVRQALRGNAPPPMLLLTERGKQIVSLAVPIQRRNATLGAVFLSTRPGEIDDILARERWIIFTLALMAFTATILASMVLDRMVAVPMRRLSAAAELVSQSITARADVPRYPGRRDEVGQMASAFSRMTSSLYRRIEASEKFAADVAHELKNPLAAARSTADALAYARTPEQRDQLVGQIQSELKRLNRLITDVSNASRLDAELARQTTEPVDVGEVLGNTVRVLRDVNADAAVEIRLEIDEQAAYPGALVVKGHEGRLGQVVTNLVDNAISFVPPDGRVTVTARRVDGEVQVTVEDNGPGIRSGDLEKVFDRFYSDRPQSDRSRGKNSGLGLSISREIVDAHGGRIWAENMKGRDENGAETILGARFVVQLPAAHAAPAKGASPLGWRQ